MKVVTLAMAIGVMSVLAQPVLAASDVKDDVKEAAQDTKKTVRKGVRQAKDKTCELVNGKMECAGKKIKHKAENTADEVKDAVN